MSELESKETVTQAEEKEGSDGAEEFQDPSDVVDDPVTHVVPAEDAKISDETEVESLVQEFKDVINESTRNLADAEGGESQAEHEVENGGESESNKEDKTGSVEVPLAQNCTETEGNGENIKPEELNDTKQETTNDDTQKGSEPSLEPAGAAAAAELKIEDTEMKKDPLMSGVETLKAVKEELAAVQENVTKAYTDIVEKPLDRMKSLVGQVGDNETFFPKGGIDKKNVARFWACCNLL